jgi:DNA-binding response OmpR family regulator
MEEDTSRKKVLLIEDDHILSDALGMKLKQVGLQVFKCDNGEDAYKKTVEIMPEVVLLDIILPKVKGTTIIQQIKKDDRLNHIPVIMLTNLSPRPSLIEELKGAEPTFFLVKSQSSLNEIIDKTKEALNILT